MQRLVAISAVAIVLAGNSFTQAGATPPTKPTTTTVAANDFNAYWITFAGGEYGQVRVHSYGSTFLYVGVYDNDGNLLAADTDRSGDAVLTFYCTYTGAYRIVVLNKAPIANPFYIATN
jgi:hypothetical protein